MGKDEQTAGGHDFETPEVKDLGDLEEVTEATAFRGPEDGATKLHDPVPVPHHSLPQGP